MHLPKRFLHDRLVLALLSVICVLVVIGVSMILLRFDAAKNPTTITAYRPNLSGSSYVSGSAVEIYELAVFMIIVTLISFVLSARAYAARRTIAVFILAGTAFVLLLSIIVSNSLISLQ